MLVLGRVPPKKNPLKKTHNNIGKILRLNVLPTNLVPDVDWRSNCWTF